jgi:hypothetical protein
MDLGHDRGASPIEDHARGRTRLHVSSSEYRGRLVSGGSPRETSDRVSKHSTPVSTKPLLRHIGIKQKQVNQFEAASKC